jgi:hypothetical protein
LFEKKSSENLANQNSLKIYCPISTTVQLSCFQVNHGSQILVVYVKFTPTKQPKTTIESTSTCKNLQKMQNLRAKTLLSTELKDVQISKFSSTRFWQGEKTPQKGTMLKFSGH